MDATLIPTPTTLHAMHPYMGLPREARAEAERAIAAAVRSVGSEHSPEAQVAALALRAFEAGFRAAKRATY